MSLLLITVALVVTSGTAQTQRTVQTAASTSVSLGDLTAQMTAPAYRRFANGQAALIVHLDLHNTSSTQRTLLANDVMLVDSRGGLFPASWHDEDGRRAMASLIRITPCWDWTLARRRALIYRF